MPTGQGSCEPWTRREEDIVRRFYAQGAVSVAARLPGRTPDAIRLRAARLGVADSKRRHSDEVRDKVEQLFMEGYGAAKVAQFAGVPISFAKMQRVGLVESLSRKGRSLPGCDITGRRVKVKDSAQYITDQQKVDLIWLWMQGWPIAKAAAEVSMSVCSASRIIQPEKQKLIDAGRPFPKKLSPSRRPRLGETPPPKAPVLADLPKSAPIARKPAQKHGAAIGPAAPAPAEKAVIAPQPRKRAPTLEEQLARIAAGASLVPTFKPTRAITEATLGGVGSALL